MITTQKKSDINVSCPNIVIPQGVVLNDVIFTDLNKEITFSYESGIKSRPLQPLTTIKIDKDKSTIGVSIIAFIEANVTINNSNTSVIQDLSYTNNKEPFLNLYVCYDVKRQPSSSFKGYRFDFTIEFDKTKYTPNPSYPDLPVPNIIDISHLTSFVWDEDPDGSRGTETTVQAGDDLTS